MAPSFAFGAGAPYSPALYAAGFGLPQEEAEDDTARLFLGGALPFSLSDGGEVLSQGLALPISVEGERLLYLYALTTAEGARGQGLLRTLIEGAKASATAHAYTALFLLPASRALTAAYRRMGFERAYPAGGAPQLLSPLDFDLLLPEAPDFCEIGREQFPTHLVSGGLSAFCLSSLGDDALPVQIGGEYAILSRTDPRRALLLPPAWEKRAERMGDHTLLLCPLLGNPPSEIVEPLPR